MAVVAVLQDASGSSVLVESDSVSGTRKRAGGRSAVDSVVGVELGWMGREHYRA